jgi:hypothetical protein
MRGLYNLITDDEMVRAYSTRGKENVFKIWLCYELSKYKFRCNWDVLQNETEPNQTTKTKKLNSVA